MAGELAVLGKIEASDMDFLEAMTYEAAIGGLMTVPSFEDAVGRGQFAYCFEEWGHPGDDGLIAFDADGEELGAAWHRAYPDKYLEAGEHRSFRPELIMAVNRDARGQGVGKALLRGLMDQARSQGIARLGLSVVENNSEALGLYRSHGFRIEREAVTVVGSEAAWVFKMSARLMGKDRKIGFEQEWYTETDYGRPRTPN